MPVRLSASDHFDPATGGAMEGMVSCDEFFQFSQARPAHRALQAIPSVIAAHPDGRERISKAGLNTNATARNAAVVVYFVPVVLCWLLSM
jgi:hypothetical protein